MILVGTYKTVVQPEFFDEIEEYKKKVISLTKKLLLYLPIQGV